MTKEKEYQYIVVRHKNLIDFTEAVNTKLADGWTLKGGVAIGVQGQLHQAMVKPKSE